MMSLTLHYHPLASFCWKALIALYENDTPFEPRLVDFGDPVSRAAFEKLWPLAKMPVLRDDARDETIPEATIIIEYLAGHHPGRTKLIPPDPDRARRVRLADRIYDAYVHEPMQKIVTDTLRPPGKNDPHGVKLASAQIVTAYDTIEAEMAAGRWPAGDDFTLADCSACPALFYADTVVRFGERHKNLAAYLDRLMARPSFARVLEEAGPYFKMFPMKDLLRRPPAGA
jgi:glutathione S-transferase